jgi:PAS domain S-box-containing protein
VVVDAFNKMLDEVESRSIALATSEKLYRAIGETINYGVWVTDADGAAIYLSDSFLKLTGMTLEQATRDGWGSALHPDDVEDTLAAWKECAHTGNAWYREHRVLGADGRYHAILAQGVPIRDDSGRIQRWAGINLDISRLKNTERALLEADRR